MNDELEYYKNQYAQMEADLQDFQASSRELEQELERDIEASEKRERQLKEKVENLGFEVEEWKVSYGFCSRNLNTDSRRPSTGKQRPKPTMRKTRWKKRSLRYETLTELSTTSFVISKWPTTTLSGKRDTRRRRWKT